MLKKRMLKRRRQLISSDDEIDPMIYAVNMVDTMLVLAVGFLIFTIMSMSMQSVIFEDMTPQERAELIKTIKQTVEVEMGQEINDTQIQNSSGSSSNMAEMGTVYKDPKTGKLIMVQNN
ncbi:DUF2149 domain-containing protein [Methanobacterium oryzae]|uniref:DUF2149 domain-containing protein n=1 Tax=Methanobacterium oryzae TaxID=69540 RepID=UPI003D2215A3